MGDTPQGSREGSRFGHYVLRRLLGRGGMSEVYEAEDTEMGRIVALKLLPESLSNDPVFRKRLRREAHSAGQLHEPHVVPIHGCGEIEGRLYVDMRLIDGTNLRSVLARFGPIDPARAVAIVRQIASALDAAHAARVTHRDVKPENILITSDDFACLVDFGIANAATDEKLTQLGTAVGTHAYMAPERFTTDQVTYRADIYSLACVLYECLTGLQPYEANSLETLIAGHLYQPIPRPSEVNPGVPVAFDDVIACGMAKDPQARYATAGDLALAAQHALTAKQQERATELLRGMPAETIADPQAVGGSQAPPPAAPVMPPAAAPQGGQPYAGQTHGGQPYAGQPYAGQPYAGQPYAGQPYAGQSYAGQPYAGQSYGGQPYGGQPSGAPPPPGPYHPAPGEWGQIPPTTPTAASKSRGPLLIVAALLAAAVLVGGGVWVGTHPSAFGLSASSTTSTSTSPATSTSASPATSTPARSTTTTAPAPTPGSSSNAEARLVTLVAVDYPAKACQPQHPGLPNAVATVGCGSTGPGGPSAAVYTFYPDRNALATAFHNVAKGMALSPCRPGGDSGEHGWHRDNAPNENVGSIACGTLNNAPWVIWTNDAEMFMGTTQGPNLNDLFTWWKSRKSP